MLSGEGLHLHDARLAAILSIHGFKDTLDILVYRFGDSFEYT